MPALLMVWFLTVQNYWDSATCAGSAQQPDNPRPLQQSDDRLPANHLGPAIKSDHAVSLVVVIGLLYMAYPDGCWHKLHSCRG